MAPRSLTGRRHLVIGFATLALLLGGFGYWSVASRIAGAVVAAGQVQVDQSRQIVQHPDGGVVETVAVREGQAVRAGDLLIRLDGSALKSEHDIVETQLFEAMARRARLEAERDDAADIRVPQELQAAAAQNPDVAELLAGQRSLFAARRETLLKQVEQLAKRADQARAQADGIAAQSVAGQRQLDLIRSELADTQGLLDKGLAQMSRVTALEREEAGLMGQLGELAALRARTEGQITEIGLESLRLSAARREEANEQLRDVTSAELQLRERRRALQDRIARLDMRAPVSGLVLGLQVTTPRAVIRPADAVLYLIPQDRPLVIAVQISPYNVDEVRLDQPVRLVLPGVQGRLMPELWGRVAVLSADAFLDQATGQSFYRAEILLTPGEMAKLDGHALLPGMPVEAFIQTGERTPLAYLLQPFTDYFRRAFRETGRHV